MVTFVAVQTVHKIKFFTMILYCQRNSFEREFATSVLSCEESTNNIPVNGKKERVKVHEVLLEDTSLFPEGGGQGSYLCYLQDVFTYSSVNHGWLDQEKVVFVERRGNDVFHAVKTPFTVGQTVKQTVDRELRFDRMQQHTGIIRNMEM